MAEDRCAVCGAGEEGAEEWGRHENTSMDRDVFTCSDQCAEIVESYRDESGWLDYVGA